MLPKFKVIQGPDRTANLQRQVNSLLKKNVLVGFPQKTAGRKEQGPTNAMLAYIHDNGSPLQNIPRREFMKTGIKTEQSAITTRLAQTARKVLDGDPAGIDKGLTGVGLIAQRSIRKKITDGPFAPLKPATIKARKRKGRMRTSPLIDTGQMRAAVNFVIRDKK